MHERTRTALAAVAALTLLGAAVLLLSGNGIGPCADRPSDPTCVAAAGDGGAGSTGSGMTGGIGGPDGEQASVEPMPTLGPIGSAATGPSATGLHVPGYTFDDEFDGTTLGPQWGRHWGSLGVSQLASSQATVADGLLSITAVNSGNGWTSDLIDTFDSFRQAYGHFEARIRIPEGRGLWPAFWLADDWAASPAEFDIAEICANPPGTNRGNDVTILHQIIHGATIYRLGQKAFRTDDLSQGWHTYSMDWRPDHVAFSFDGVETWRYTDAALIPAMPMTVILSLELGTWCGPPDATTPSPSVMQVDWVRVTA